MVREVERGGCDFLGAGEQSHKSLRAERMADCIFNGTTKRPPMGLAEVTITMEDPDLAEAARFVLRALRRKKTRDLTQSPQRLEAQRA